MMRSKITRILSYKHQKHQKNYSTFRQFSNYTHHSALFRGAKLRNSGTPKGQVTVLIYDNTLLLFRIRTCPLSPSSGVLPLTLLNLGCTRHSSSELGSALICTRFQAAFVVCYLYRGRCPRLLMVVPSRHQSASSLYFTTDLTNRTDSCPIWEQNINQKNPLATMEGVTLMLCFRSGLIRASS